MLLLSAEHSFKISCLMGRHHMKGGSESHLTDQVSRLEQCSNITLFLLKTCRDYFNLYINLYINFVLPGIFLGYVLSAGRILVADIEELEEMDASELHARRLNAKEVLTPTKGEKFKFPVADGTVKISGEDQDLRTSTFLRDSPDRGEKNKIIFEENQTGLPQPYEKTHHGMMVKPKVIFGLSPRIFYLP